MAQEIKRPATGDRTASRQRLTVAVCLPTYNGERFLQEQLDSIAEQRAVPDELLVSDDHSTDSTVEIVKAFARSAPMKVRLSVNETNLGLAPNTARLVRSAESDVLFFADQDDIWKPDKVEKMLVPFADPRIEAVVSDSQPFDSDSGAPIGGSLWRTALRGIQPTPSLAVLAWRVFASGHNLAARRSALLDALWPDGSDIWPDYWLTLVFAARGTIALVDDALVLYRQHCGNAIGMRGRRSWQHNVVNWSKTANTLEDVQLFLCEMGVDLRASDASLMTRRARFMRQRVEFLRHPRRNVATPFQLFCSADGYGLFANGWRSFVGDLLALVDRPGLGVSAISTPRGGRQGGPSARLRLGVYADLSYRRDEHGVSSSSAFIAWLAQLAEEVDELVLFGRLSPESARAQFPLPERANICFVPLPFYENLHQISEVARTTVEALHIFRSELAGLDAVLLFGPHPLSDLFGLRARLSRVPAIVGVREDLREYLFHRTDGWKQRVARPLAGVLEGFHKAVSFRTAAIVVGDDMSARYTSPFRAVLTTGISLLKPGDVVPLEEAVHRPWPGSHVIAEVGRLDPEKNSMMLIDLGEELRKLGPWRLEVAGTGRLADRMQFEIERRGLSDVVQLRGRIDRRALSELYRRACVFVHVSYTEGQPQVLYEAAAAGLPIIATSVGGVATALGHGERGILVPPADVGAFVSALRTLDGDPAMRQKMVEAAWHWAAEDTCDVQVARVVRFIVDVVASCRGQAAGPSSKSLSAL
ncbi:MAG: glycosyltransferase [Actinomycetota bacterium]|nr:glycosyltransferase [Actinomycetota bacterium]